MRPGSFLPAARVKHSEQSAKGVIRCRSSSGTGRFSFVGTVVIFVLSPRGWRLLYIWGGGSLDPVQAYRSVKRTG